MCKESIQRLTARDLLSRKPGNYSFETAQILSEDKRDKIEESLLWCGQHIALSEELLRLGKALESRCRLRNRDALHVAAALLGNARYFLSCDRQLTEMKQARCYRRLAPSNRAYFSAMNPRLFAQKLKKGEIE